MAARGQNQPQKVVPIVIEGFEINAQNVTFQKLQEFSLTLYEKLVKQREERNFLLLERDKLRTILENTRHEIGVVNDIARNKETELEKALERHRQERKEVDQEVKYILYEQKINLSDLKAWEEKMLEQSAGQNLVEELQLLHEKRKLKEELAEEDNKNMQELENIKNTNLEKLTQLKTHHHEIQNTQELEFKRNLNNTREILTLKHEMEMSEIEERKNTHLTELKTIHKTRLDEMKSFFNSITAENLTVISNLKQSLDALKKSKSSMSTEIKQLKRQNEKLKEPLEKSKAEVKNLTRQLTNYEKDLVSLKNNRRLLKQTTQDTKKITKQTNLALKKIRSDYYQDVSRSLKSSFLYSLVDFKNETVFKRRHLEELIDKLVEDLERKQNTLLDLMSDPDIRDSLQQLNFEFWQPRKMAFELGLVCKAHDELVETLREKLEEFCIPESQPEREKFAKDYFLGAGPAAVVSEQ